MKKVEHYVCEICGTEYAEKIKCERCENNHKKPISIAKARFLPFTNNKKGYPLTVDIVMEDGETVTYKR